MSSSSVLPKGYFPVQTRVSKGRNPELYAHLARESQNGEAPGAIIRRLAEEALMLRNHPLTKAMQALDFKGESRTAFNNTHQGGNERNSEPVITSAPALKSPPAQKAPETPAAKAPTTGAQQMAAALVGRMPGGAAHRG